MNDYVTVFINSAFAAGNPTAPLSLLFLFFGRMFPIIALSPFLGAKVLPHPVKVFFAMCLFAIFLPMLVNVTLTPLKYDMHLLAMMVKELFVGVILGFLVSMPFSIVQNVGMIIDHQRGGASLMVNDPTIQNQSSPLGTLFNMIMIFIFYYINGPFYFIEAIITSYELIPPDKFFNMSFFGEKTAFWQMIIKLFQTVMDISVRLATPALIAMLMTDVFLGIANRLAPQVQITFLGMPLKSLLGLMVIFIGWNLFVGELGKQGIYWINSIKEAISMMAGYTVSVSVPPLSGN